jgi:predicted nucleic-acid-binding Zn-ribbon protein
MKNKIPIEKRKFIVKMVCSECKEPLNQSKEFDHKEIQQRWTSIVMSSGFNAGRCPNCKYSTFSDLNIGTKLTVYDKELDIPIEFDLFKKLSGHFYADEYNDICDCNKKIPTFVSEKYPIEVHTCGKFLKPYKR